MISTTYWEGNAWRPSFGSGTLLGMELNSDPVFEMRTDPTTGRRVLIAEGRALRPNDFVGEPAKAISHHTSDCPFCAGNENATPHELAVVNDAAGHWQVRVVPNKYPAVSLASGGHQSPADDALEDAGLRPPLACAHGVHEVIIESPRHITDWSELSTDELATVLTVFRDRIELAHEEHQLPSSLIFKNVGQAAGASLEHVHSQLVALPFVPEVLECELRIASEFHASKGNCLFCEILADELRNQSRLVIENDHFAAICAYAGRQPYETWILPKSHAASFTTLSSKESHALAAILIELVCRLGAVLAPLAYNLVLHTAPLNDERAASFHWHWELIPRSTSLAGFEWGTGMYINSVSPERAAIRLRASKSGEILPIQ